MLSFVKLFASVTLFDILRLRLINLPRPLLPPFQTLSPLSSCTHHKVSTELSIEVNVLFIIAKAMLSKLIMNNVSSTLRQS